MKVLQFSGGKDSLACLLLLKDQLHEITVMWCDTGDSFPEVLAQMELVKSICPNYLVVNGRQPEQITQSGYPVDVLPIRNHSTGNNATGENRVNLQSFIECCNKSWWQPMQDATVALGATTIIRGQKLFDADKSSARDGDVIEGITYSFPIENWTDNEVLEFVKPSGLLPDYYNEVSTSLECMHCTAYLGQWKDKRKYIANKYPEVGKELNKRFAIIMHETMRDMQHLTLES